MSVSEALQLMFGFGGTIIATISLNVTIALAIQKNSTKK